MKTPATTRRRILIADDDPDVLWVLGMLVKNWGHEPVFARDGAEAWEVLRSGDPPRLAVLDWGMPRVDGLEVCRLTRDAYPFRPQYLILLAGGGSREDVVAGLEGGADECLTKPVDPAELKARLSAARRVIDLQERLAEQARALENPLFVDEVAGEDSPGLGRTLRLCAATFTAALALSRVPNHLRTALRICRGLCQASLGQEEKVR